VLGAVKLANGLSVLEPTQQNGFWAVHGELQRMTVKTGVPIDENQVEANEQGINTDQSLKYDPEILTPLEYADEVVSRALSVLQDPKLNSSLLSRADKFKSGREFERALSDEVQKLVDNCRFAVGSEITLRSRQATTKSGKPRSAKVLISGKPKGRRFDIVIADKLTNQVVVTIEAKLTAHAVKASQLLVEDKVTSTNQAVVEIDGQIFSVIKNTVRPLAVKKQGYFFIDGDADQVFG
jgi:hypothetical protein